MSDKRDSEGKYQDDLEDVTIQAGKRSQEKRQQAAKKEEAEREAKKQEASKTAMFNAGKDSREKRKGKET
ncbi:hypothetical protein JX265_001370 [Neoarthrinium moseri]|uniref:Uncharacterized protein n=1 Tax=Neoarthrinium moseri TaxID=1658444 RepID=A0A9P9WXW9_9PEZI|nr:hypothetical protein JX265_001370 [Neoarthrinium moseri]